MTVIDLSPHLAFYGKPLELHIKTTRKNGVFYVRAYVPVPYGLDGIHTEFMTNIRKKNEKSPCIGYILIKINRFTGELPFYIQEFYVYSNVLSNGALKEEKTKGLGKAILCSTFQYFQTQSWFRPYIDSDENNIYLIAAGGQCNDEEIDRIGDSVRDLLQELRHFPSTLLEVLINIWQELIETTDTTLNDIINSIVLPKLGRRFKDIVDTVNASREFIINVAGEDVELSELEDLEESAEKSINKMEAIDMLAIAFDLDTASGQDFILKYLETLDIEHKEWGIMHHIKHNVCMLRDNHQLVRYYTHYGFEVDDSKNGLFVRMIGNIKKILSSCSSQSKKGVRSRRKKMRHSKKI
jgi:hypothetical protein